jgi:hypothetical protein
MLYCLPTTSVVLPKRNTEVAWGSVMFKALRYKSEGPGVAGFFSVASDSSMCPGVDSASKNEYQVNPGGKGDLCVRLTTFMCRCQEIWEPKPPGTLWVSSGL